MNEQTPAYTTPKPRGNRKRHGRRGTKHADARSRELNVLRKRCAQQRRELERLKAIVTVASTSDVENVIIVKTTDGKADE